MKREKLLHNVKVLRYSYLPNVSFEKFSIEATVDDATMIMIRLVSHISWENFFYRFLTRI